MSAVNVLDIDLDVFLDPRPNSHSRHGRLPSTECRSWSPEQVEKYLVRRCNLSNKNPIPGKVVTYHHELFDIWDNLTADGTLAAPFSLTHVDSHADMGMGDGSCGYILCDLLHGDQSRRRNPKRNGHDGLLEGNYVSFALACRWIRNIKYVEHPETRSHNDAGLPDIADCLFKDNDPSSGVIQLRTFPRGCNNGVDRFWQTVEPVNHEPEVPIEFHNRDIFLSENTYSFLFVAQSPNYTPKASDKILSIVDKFIRPIRS